MDRWEKLEVEAMPVTRVEYGMGCHGHTMVLLYPFFTAHFLDVSYKVILVSLLGPARRALPQQALPELSTSCC